MCLYIVCIGEIGAWKMELFSLLVIFVGSCTPEKAATLGVGTTDQGSSPQVHHQITITSGNIGTVTDGRSILRRNSVKRSSYRVIDPKKIVLAFATL